MRGSGKKMTINCDAVSEVLGLVLLTAIAVIAMSGTAAVLFSYEIPEDTPHTAIQEWVDTSSGILYLKHGGGDLIDVENLEIVVRVNEDRYVCTPAEVAGALGKEIWKPGDVIKIDLKEKWGLYPENGDCIEILLVHKRSREVM